MVASLRPVKHLTMAIEAFLAVEKDAPNVSLLLIGPILDEKESGRILRLGNKLRCFTYLGERPPDEVRRYMQSADVFLNTSLNEGMPGAVLEAMAEGLPVLASDVTGNRTLVVHEKNGLLFPVADVRALMEAACRLIRDEALRKRLGRAGSALALSHYSVEREVDGYRRIYEELLLVRAPNQTPRASSSRSRRQAQLTSCPGSGSRLRKRLS